MPPKTIYETPDAYNLPYQDVWLPIKTNWGIQRIHGWWLPHAPCANCECANCEVDRPTLLYFHGNASNVSTEISMAQRFYQLGFSVLLIDYRGYGQSEGGFPSESKAYQDAQTGWDFLTQTQKIPAQEIILYGHSLGGAIALDLASKHPDVAGVIVQNTFTSMQAMAKRNWAFRLFPIELILTQQFNSLKKVSSLKAPVLFIHGTTDTHIPVEMSKTLYAAVPQPKQLLLIPNGEHNHTDLLFEPPARQDLQDFLKRSLKLPKT
ncbi:MAG: alpha/beta hydrolase [Leptolyngbyaceae cyanobacterium CSU_1_3]|nr:alpha/beta hydrolase [Leptolyngbyaceae cyanobacterium CSU_1_3]